MKRLRWQILVVVLTLTLVAVLLFSQQPVLAPVSNQPTSGGIYTEAVIGSFGRLNPVFDLHNQADRDVDRLVYSGLIRFDAAGLPQPDLAESWGMSQDGMIYNFSIRPEARWHDGQPVTSDDILFTLSLLRSQFSAYSDDVRALWDQVEITRLDERTLKFTLPEPYAPFLDYLTFGILPQHLLGTVQADQLMNADFNLHPVGSGPYRFDQLLVEDDRIIGVALSVFEDYYGAKPFKKQIVIRYFESAQAALAAYQEGEALGINQVTADILPAALADPNLGLYSGRLPALSMVMLNLNNPERPFFQERDVRKALLMAINRQWLVDRILDGQAILADSPIFPGTWAYYGNVEQVTYDPQAAIALLKEAGYVLPADGQVRTKDGLALSFTLLHLDDGLHTAVAQAIQQDWAGVGVQAALQPVTLEQMQSAYLAPRAYEAALVDLDLSRAHDPDPYPFWHQSESLSGQNYAQWDNRAASEYIEQARVVADTEARTRLYRNFQVIFAREIPSLLLYYPVYTYGVDLRVNNIQIAPLFDTSDRFMTISDWYLVTRRALEQTAEPGTP